MFLSFQVLHSQRLRDTALVPWVIAEEDGKILASHCTCMAGLGETCTHVAALLFAVDGTVKVRDSRTVTQDPAYWLLPTSVKNVNYSETRDIDFSSAKSLKKKFDIKCDATQNVQVHSSSTKKRQVPEPSQDELNSFFSNIAATGRKPAILSVIPDFSDNYIPKKVTQNLPKPLTELKDNDAILLNYKELLDQCSLMKLEISGDQIENVERATRQQAKEKKWFSFRAGRITASNMKSVCSTDPDSPSQSLIKKVCYPNNSLKLDATAWGVENEEKAKKAFMETFKNNHENATLEDSGLHICQEKPFVAASPDGIINCDCCGKFCLEVKCPYKLKDKKIDQSVGYLRLEDTGSLTLDKEHAHYYQIQTQLGVTNTESCFFVVWTDVDLFEEQIWFDQQLWVSMGVKAESFFYKAILPELVGKFYSRLSGSGSQEVAVKALQQQDENNNVKQQDENNNVKNSTESTDEERWCYCDQVESGKMIYCDNQNCLISWFHFACLKMSNEPRGKTWYCPDCRKLPQFKKGKKKVQ